MAAGHGQESKAKADNASWTARAVARDEEQASSAWADSHQVRTPLDDKLTIPCHDPGCKNTDKHTLGECGKETMQEAMNISDDELPWAKETAKPAPVILGPTAPADDVDEFDLEDDSPWEGADDELPWADDDAPFQLDTVSGSAGAGDGDAGDGGSGDADAPPVARGLADAPAPEWERDDEDMPWDHSATKEKETVGIADDSERIQIECPACGTRKLARQENWPTDCADCGSRFIRVRMSTGTWPVTDWARCLVIHGVRKQLESPAECRLCPRAMGNGTLVYQVEKCASTVAHATCVEIELGPELAYAATRDQVMVSNVVARCSLCDQDIAPGVKHCPHPELPDVVAHIKCIDGDEEPVKENDDRDPCEWNPRANRATRAGDPFHGRAELLVGSGKSQARLCRKCRQVPPWTRKRKAVELEVSQ